MEELNTDKCVDLDSCMEWIMDGHKDDPQFMRVFGMSENDALCETHHGFGTWLRNTLGLWHEGTPVKYFNELGIYHADDMSGIILTSLHRKINNVDIDLDKQVKGYRDYWEENRPEVNQGNLN